MLNKLRGDVRLLSPGPEILLKKTGVPTLGVVPYVRLDLLLVPHREPVIQKGVLPALARVVGGLPRILVPARRRRIVADQADLRVWEPSEWNQQWT